MRYYKYNLEYYYIGFIESEEVTPSSTTTSPESEDHIVWNPTAKVWELEAIYVLTLDEEKTLKHKDTFSYFEDIMDSVKATMANFEADTYHTQETEWREYVLDTTALTPYVDKLAERRGKSREELMQRIGGNVMFFADIQGQMHSLEDAIDSCTTIEQLESIPYPWL